MGKISVVTGYVLLLAFSAVAQTGIGTDNPTRAMLEVHGVAEAGTTSAIFGGSLGISLQRNLPAIGFNEYNQDSTNAFAGRYLGNGYAASLIYRHNDPTLSNGMVLNFYPPGNAESPLPSPTRILRFTNNNRFSILVDGNAVLDVGRGNGGDGTAKFLGSTYNSHFNYSTSENTYIRSGKGNHVFINDINGGKVVFGNGLARVGINTSSPVYPLEIRQVAGTGIRVMNAAYTSQFWEWRIANSPSNFYAYYKGVVKTYFSPSDGSLHPVSDARLKEDVRQLSPVINKILQLQPMSYQMIKDNPNRVRSIGFIAQDVQPLFPQLVNEGATKDDKLSLHYAGFGVIAIKGIQEEEKLIEQVAEKIGSIEDRLAQIEKRIAALQKQN